MEQIEQQVEELEQDQQLEETVSKSQYDTLLVELEDVKSKLPTAPTEEEQALATKQAELWQKEVSLTLKENGLDQFSSIVKVADQEELKQVIGTLTKVVNDIKVSMGYVPENHRQQDAYTQAESKKDVSGMLSAKIANLFK